MPCIGQNFCVRVGDPYSVEEFTHFDSEVNWTVKKVSQVM